MLRPPPRMGGQRSRADLARAAIARAAATNPGIEVGLKGYEARDGDLAEAAEGLSADDMVCLLAEPGGASKGLAVVSGDLRTALVERRTTGDVSTLRCDPRPATPTDFALCRDALAHWLAELAPDGGARPKSLIADPREIEFALPDTGYSVVDLDLDLADGARTGRLVVYLPRAADHGARAVDGTALIDALSGVEQSFEAVALRLQVPLARIAGLAEGDILPLDADGFHAATLESPPGRPRARVELGQSRGWRAVRLVAPGEISPGPAEPDPAPIAAPDPQREASESI